MENKKISKLIIIILVIYSITITILYVCKRQECLKISNELYQFIHTEAAPITTTFYAQIKNVDFENNTILVEGLDFDSVYDGEYKLEISNETWLVCAGNIMKISDFANGNHVAVTYSGVIEVGNPDIISKVHKIQVLDK